MTTRDQQQAEKDAVKFLELLLSDCSGIADHAWRKCRRCLALSELEQRQPLALAFMANAINALRQHGALVAANEALLDASRTLIKYCSQRDGSLASYEDWMQCFIEDGSTITDAVEKAQAALALSDASPQEPTDG